MNENIAEEEAIDFEEIEADLEKTRGTEQPHTTEAPARVRMPREGEAIGIISQRLGGSRMEVLCSDGKTRNCRVPGRYKRSLWLRPKDVVLVELWEHDKEKGDVIFKYNPAAVNQLRKRGLLADLQDKF